MAIEVECPCGKRLKAPESLAGRTAKCPACGGRSVIVDLPVLEPAGLPPPKAITLELDAVNARFGYAAVSLHVAENGDGTVRVYACEANTRRRGEVLILYPHEFEEFAALVDRTRETIAALTKQGRVNKMLPGGAIVRG